MAFLNHAGFHLFTHWEYLERLSPKKKLDLITDHLSIEADASKSPWQIVDELFRFRNEIAHGKSSTLKANPKFLNLGQTEPPAAAQVTESYISQLLARKKAPAAPGRTDIYEEMGRFLKLPNEELSKLAELQRQEDLRKKTAEPPKPLFEEFRELILRKCSSETREEIRRIFEKEPFGELERWTSQTLPTTLAHSSERTGR